LFFTAGIDDEEHGLFGTITPWSRGVDHDVITSLLTPESEGPGTTPSVQNNNNQSSILQQPNFVTPIVILPKDEEDEALAPKDKKKKKKTEE
jgi:hypothetical protein